MKYRRRRSRGHRSRSAREDRLRCRGHGRSPVFSYARLPTVAGVLQPYQTHVIDYIRPTRRITAQPNRQLITATVPAGRFAIRKRIRPRLIGPRLLITVGRANVHQLPNTGERIAHAARHAGLPARNCDLGGVSEVVFDIVAERGDILFDVGAAVGEELAVGHAKVAGVERSASIGSTGGSWQWQLTPDYSRQGRFLGKCWCIARCPDWSRGRRSRDRASRCSRSGSHRS